jgi:RNA polymerase sigma factor (sigma-70 family)
MTAGTPSQHFVTDAGLVRAAADGDRRALAAIYQLYANRLYDYCLRELADRDAAADCVQEAFCEAARDLAMLRDPAKLRPWLYGIARHQVMRRVRQRRREEIREQFPDEVSGEPGPSTVVRRSEMAALIADAADGLSERDRTVLELAYRQGLNGPELAAALGVSLTHANTLVYRLRETMQRCLGALLIAHAARHQPACLELGAIVAGWDGQFSPLIRKRIARHIDSCPTCGQQSHRMVNLAALLGGEGELTRLRASHRNGAVNKPRSRIRCHAEVVHTRPKTFPPST